MEKDLMDRKKSVLVTGTSTGIGKACAIHLAELGFRVYACVRRKEDAEKLQAESPDRLRPAILDVTRPETIQSILATVWEGDDQPLWGLVNNAGIGLGGVLEAIPVEDFRRVLEVNLTGLFSVTKAFLPLIRRSSGRIVNIGSSASFMAGPGASSYAASKFAVRGLTDSLRLEMKPFGVGVSLVAPGAIESDIWGKSKTYKEKLRETVSPELLEVYAYFIRAGDRIADFMKPIPAVRVARAVEHALTARRPKPVYLVGHDARHAFIASKLCRRFTDWIIMKHFDRLADGGK
jgi:NAD(P)-dependent dehydrogenase (short-subunit alcohol dehydrogenase family)